MGQSHAPKLCAMDDMLIIVMSLHLRAAYNYSFHLSPSSFPAFEFLISAGVPDYSVDGSTSALYSAEE